jgi:hypothetical protein
MNFSKLAETYERVSAARNDTENVRLLADVFRKADRVKQMH